MHVEFARKVTKHMQSDENRMTESRRIENKSVIMLTDSAQSELVQAIAQCSAIQLAVKGEVICNSALTR